MQGAVAWTYDNDFRITTETVRNAFSVNFGYDDDGLLMSAGDTTYTRFAATGLLESSTVGSVATSFGYNGFGELTSHATTVGATPVYAATLGRDAGGRIDQQTDTLGATTTVDVYGYDPAGRLETVTRNGTLAVTYGYDANGNRHAVTTAGGTIAATFDAQDRILTFGTRTYTHTPHGDVAGWTDSATSTTTTLTYDVQGNLRQFQQPGATITYTVDGRNRRIGTAVNGVPVQGFLWQGQLRPVAELDGAGTLVSRFVYGTRINVPEYMERGGTTYRLVTDHLGSVRLVIDTTTNTVVQALTYDPWGVVVTDTNPGFQPFGYAGGLYDHRTGLVRFGVRDYDATIGRWLAKDPLSFAGGDTGLYSYAANSPIGIFDPEGASWAESFLEAARMTFQWATGTGPDEPRIFGEGSSRVNDMKDAYRVKKARELYRQKNALSCGPGLVGVDNYRGSFGLLDLLWRAGLDPTEQFVGSYRVDILPNADGSATYVLTNTTSLQSLLYGIGPSYDRSSFRPGGNMTQIYTWTER